MGHTRGAQIGWRSRVLEHMALTSPFMHTHWQEANADGESVAAARAITARIRECMLFLLVRAANAKLRGGYKRRAKCEACADWRRPVAQPRP